MNLPLEVMPLPSAAQIIPAEIVGAEIASVLQLPSPENIVDAVERFVRDYWVLPEAAYLPVSLWIIATHFAMEFDAFPYIALLSPMKRSGKTRGLEIFHLLCANPVLCTAITPAVLFRKMKSCPTLLLDEAEKLNTKNPSHADEEIRAVLNAGHRKLGSVARCTMRKGVVEIEDFPVYGPKAFAAIGSLKDTLADRSICIQMVRKTASQKTQPFLYTRVAKSVVPLKEAIAQFAEANREDVRDTYFAMPHPTYLDDREADLWMSLLALCAVAAIHRFDELKACIELLCAAKADDDVDESIQLQFLRDVNSVWPAGAKTLSAAFILEKLQELEDSPWSNLTRYEQRRHFEWFKMRPEQIQPANKKGYKRSDFDRVLARFLPTLQTHAAT